MVLDDDIYQRLYREIERHDPSGQPVDYSDAKVRLIIDMIDSSPRHWGPKAIHARIRNIPRHDVSEALIRNVMNAMAPSDIW